MRHVLILLFFLSLSEANRKVFNRGKPRENRGNRGKASKKASFYPGNGLVVFEKPDDFGVFANETVICGGFFLTRYHVLTTSNCALKTKKHQLVPRRLNQKRKGKSYLSFQKKDPAAETTLPYQTSVSKDSVSGNISSFSQIFSLGLLRNTWIWKWRSIWSVPDARAIHNFRISILNLEPFLFAKNFNRFAWKLPYMAKSINPLIACQFTKKNI